MEGNKNQSSEPVSNQTGIRTGILKNIIVVILVIAILITNICVILQYKKIDELESEIKDLQTQTKQLIELTEEQAMQSKIDAGKATVMNEETDGESVSDSDALAVNEEGRKVYLTFDDGPSAQTDAILDILKEYDVKATFFVIGKEDEASKARMKRIVEEGHTIGVHSYSHDYSKIYASVEAYAEDFKKLQTLIYDTTGVETKYYRFPGGSSNTASKVEMKYLAEYLDSQGVTYYDWNVDSGDGSSRYLSTKMLVDNCMKDVAVWKQNAVILLHDSAEKSATAEALPALLESLKALENTQILPITEQTVPVQHFKTEKKPEAGIEEATNPEQEAVTEETQNPVTEP